MMLYRQLAASCNSPVTSHSSSQLQGDGRMTSSIDNIAAGHSEHGCVATLEMTKSTVIKSTPSARTRPLHMLRALQPPLSATQTPADNNKSDNRFNPVMPACGSLSSQQGEKVNAGSNCVHSASSEALATSPKLGQQRRLQQRHKSQATSSGRCIPVNHHVLSVRT